MGGHCGWLCERLVDRSRNNLAGLDDALGTTRLKLIVISQISVTVAHILKGGVAGAFQQHQNRLSGQQHIKVKMLNIISVLAQIISLNASEGKNKETVLCYESLGQALLIFVQILLRSSRNERDKWTYQCLR